MRRKPARLQGLLPIPPGAASLRGQVRQLVPGSLSPQSLPWELNPRAPARRLLYLQLRHAANEFVGELHVGLLRVIERDQLRGQVTVPVKQPASKERSLSHLWDAGPGRGGRVWLLSSMLDWQESIITEQHARSHPR